MPYKWIVNVLTVNSKYCSRVSITAQYSFLMGSGNNGSYHVTAFGPLQKDSWWLLTFDNLRSLACLTGQLENWV